jgi:GT2 family glycosyltransferase
MLRIATATRLDQATFLREALTGRTLKRLLSRKDVRGVVAFQNTRGLSEVYNAALVDADVADMIVFTHDDVWIDDWFLPERLEEALGRFAVVGVAGTRRRIPRQPSWAYLDGKFTSDVAENMSGAIQHIRGSVEELSWFGATPGTVKLLDGVFLAARVRTLRAMGVMFDPQFTFHFYDVDFCRSCERAGLEMGTWPIPLTHGSPGHFGTPDWTQAYDAYLRKWGD